MQVLVAGMHRSGTSMVTRLLNLAGCYVGLPEEMMQGMPDNPGGYWERNDICELNTNALNAAGVDWNTTLGNEFDTVGPGRRKEIVHGFREVIQGLEEHRPWAVKDPRLSILLPLWRPLLSDPVVVICHRHPLEVARSLQGRDGMPIGIGVALWEVYTLAILQNTRKIQRIFVSHEELLGTPIETVKSLLAQLQKMGASTLKVPTKAEIIGLIDGKLNRSRMALDQTADYLGAGQLRLLESVNTAHGLNDWSLEDLSESTKDLIVFYREATTSGIERRESAMALVTELAESFGDDKDKMAAEIQRVHIKMADVGARYDNANRERAELGERLKSERAENRRLKQELAASRNEQSKLSGRLLQTHEDMAKLGQLLEDLNTEKDQLARDLGRVHGEKKEIGLRLESAGLEAVGLRERFEGLRRERAALDEKMQKSHDDRIGLAARLEQVHEEMQRLGALFEKTNAERDRLAQDVVHVHEEKGVIGLQLETAGAQITSLQQELEALRQDRSALDVEVQKSREDRAGLAARLEQVHEEMQRLGTLLEKTLAEKVSIGDELRRLYVSNQEMGTKLEFATSETQNAVSRARDLEATSGELEKELARSREEGIKLRATLEQLHRNMEEVGALLEKTADDNRALSAELQETHGAKAELGLRFDQVNVASQKIESELNALRKTHSEMKASLEEVAGERDRWKTRFQDIEAQLQDSNAEVEDLRTWQRDLEETRTFRIYRALQRRFGATGMSSAKKSIEREKTEKTTTPDIAEKSV